MILPSLKNNTRIAGEPQLKGKDVDEIMFKGGKK